MNFRNTENAMPGLVRSCKYSFTPPAAALSRGFDVAALRCRALIDAFGKSLAKLSGVTPAGFFFTFFAPRLPPSLRCRALIDGGKRAAPGKLRLRLRWAQGMVSVYLLWY